MARQGLLRAEGTLAVDTPERLPISNQSAEECALLHGYWVTTWPPALTSTYLLSETAPAQLLKTTSCI